VSAPSHRGPIWKRETRSEVHAAWPFQRHRMGWKTEVTADGKEAWYSLGVHLKEFFQAGPEAAVPVRDAFRMICEMALNGSTPLAIKLAESKKEISTLEPKKGRRRRKSSDKNPRPLTDRENEAVEVLGHNEGNVSAAAKEMGITRQALSKAKNNALKKLYAMGGNVPDWLKKKPARMRIGKPNRLPQDRRGQVDIRDPKATDPKSFDG
jgi:predicted DNA-binding protein (UPF0251 family)